MNGKRIQIDLTPYGQRRCLADHVAEQLAERIRDGSLKPGDQLPTEARLVADLGVSRSVVREAIARLRSEGFVEPRQGKGVFVTDWSACTSFRVNADRLLNPADLKAVLELRREVESGAAALAAHRRSGEELARLRRCVARMSEAGHGEDASEADVAFHATLATATHNRYYGEFMQYIDRQLRIAVAASHRRSADQSEQAQAILNEHRQILEAIERRDAAAAREAVRTHLGNVRIRLELESVDD